MLYRVLRQKSEELDAKPNCSEVKNRLSLWREIDVSEQTGKDENNISNCDFAKESSKASWLNYANHPINLNGREIVILKIQSVRHQENSQFSCLYEGHRSHGIIIKVSPRFRSIQMPRWRWLALTATRDNEVAPKACYAKISQRRIETETNFC